MTPPIHPATFARAFIVAPGDDAAALAAALASAADAVVVALDVAAGRREAALRHARALGARPVQARPRVVMRLNPLASGESDRDLEAVMAAAPVAVLLPATRGRADVERLSSKLAVAEALNGIDDGTTAIVASLDTGEGLLGAASLVRSSPRLAAIAWDAAALAADLGAEASRGDDGAFVEPLRVARATALFAAAAARVAAIDAAFPGDPEPGLFAMEAEAARRFGFAAKLALDPAQAAIVDAVFAGARGPAGGV